MPQKVLDSLSQKAIYWALRPKWARYVVAIGAVAAAFAIRVEFSRALGVRSLYVTFYPAVAVAALYGGLSSGLCATVLCALLADYFGWSRSDRSLSEIPVICSAWSFSSQDAR